jgi:uncharacterized membrane protein
MLPTGLHYLKSSIRLHAPVEVCYQTWLDSRKLADIMERVLGVVVRSNLSINNMEALTSAEEIQTKIQLFKQDIMPSSKIKQWLINGPGGKYYEVENTKVLEIPNHFYSTVSTDLADFCMQSSVTFMADAMNQNTIIEWEVSYWGSFQNGTSTQLAIDISETNDSFMKDCLMDFKHYLESNGPYPFKPASEPHDL